MKSLTIGQLAAAAGVNLETVRYYERINLMPSPARTASGYRAYEAEHVRKLAFIRRARELGFSIEQIRALLALAQPSRASCAEVRKIAQTHLDEVRAKIADLAKTRKHFGRDNRSLFGRPRSLMSRAGHAGNARAWKNQKFRNGDHRIHLKGLACVVGRGIAPEFRLCR